LTFTSLLRQPGDGVGDAVEIGAHDGVAGDAVLHYHKGGHGCDAGRLGQPRRLVHVDLEELDVGVRGVVGL